MKRKMGAGRIGRGLLALLIFCAMMGWGIWGSGLYAFTAKAEQTDAPQATGEPEATQAPQEQATPTPTLTPAPEATENPQADQKALKVTSGINPEQMASPGQASVRIALSNTTGAVLEDVSLYDGEGNIVYGPVRIPAGDGEGARTYSAEIQVSKRQLADGYVRYSVNYVMGKGTDRERTVQKQINIKIKKVKARPKLEFSREISSRFVTEGSEVTLTYRLRNTGNVKLTDIRVSDELGGEVGSLSSLDVGRKKTFTQKVVIREGQVSRPKVSYSFEGSEKTRTEKLKSSEIALAREELVLELSASRSTVNPGDKVNLTLRLINNGNVSYSKLRISDPVLGDLGSLANDLKAGQEYVFSKEVPIKSSTSFQFHVTGRCATNSEISYKSNLCMVSVNNPSQSGIRLRLQAETQTPFINGPGPVTFTLHLYNEGDLDIRDVMLSEQTSGAIKRMAVLAPGETQLEQTYQLTKSGTFVFVAQVSDGQGGSMTVLSDPIEVEVGSAAPVISGETGAPSASGGGNAFKLPENPRIFRNMMLLVGSLLAIILIFAVAGGMRRRKKRIMQQRRRAAQHRARPKRENRPESAEHAPGRMPPIGVADKPDEMGDTQRFHIGRRHPTDMN